MRSLRVALAQINPTVGDLDGNARKIIEYIQRARDSQADMVAFPEMAITGYPPEDLLLKPQFTRDNLEALEQVARACDGITAVVGFVDAGEDLYNAAAIINGGRVVAVYHKIFLPTYGVFDEDRYFRAGDTCPVYTINGTHVGVNICEDIWYPAGPTTAQMVAGAEVIININASPYYFGKHRNRERMVATRASDNVLIVCYLNTVGGQDELVFDGASAVFDQHGEMIARAKHFQEDLLVVDLDVESVFRARLHDPRWRKERSMPGSQQWPAPVVHLSADPTATRAELAGPKVEPALSGPAEVYAALVLGAGDYVRKNGFQQVVIGLSGGIDSSLTAAVAVDALGAGNVIGVAMPSRYSSPESLEDAQKLAANLGIRLITISIEDAFEAMLRTLEPVFTGTQPGIAEENLQARVRGNILMALSNKFGYLVLTTGNKSEMATGYSTLYGDMAGGFEVIKDVRKTMVYDLAHYRNASAGYDLIPRRVLEKPPSAELRPDQRDADSLPPYEELDQILHAYVEEDRGYDEIVAMGFAPDVVKKVINLVDHAEYKRRQAPPGIKITPRAFGRDRRPPITNRYSNW